MIILNGVCCTISLTTALFRNFPLCAALALTSRAWYQLSETQVWKSPYGWCLCAYTRSSFSFYFCGDYTNKAHLCVWYGHSWHWDGQSSLAGMKPLPSFIMVPVQVMKCARQQMEPAVRQKNVNPLADKERLVLAVAAFFRAVSSFLCNIRNLSSFQAQMFSLIQKEQTK